MLSQSFEVLSWTAVPIGKVAPVFLQNGFPDGRKGPHNSAGDYSARVAAIARRSKRTCAGRRYLLPRCRPSRLDSQSWCALLCCESAAALVECIGFCCEQYRAKFIAKPSWRTDMTSSETAAGTTAW